MGDAYDEVVDEFITGVIERLKADEMEDDTYTFTAYGFIKHRARNNPHLVARAVLRLVKQNEGL